jgi:hypothetical protein
MGQATILFYFSDASTKENGALIISADRESWKGLLESVVNEAYKAKNRISEAQHA